MPLIAVVGDLILDEYVYTTGGSDRVHPEEVPCGVVSRVEHRLGGAGAVAAMIGELGCDVMLLGPLGPTRDSVDAGSEAYRRLLDESPVHDQAWCGYERMPRKVRFMAGGRVTRRLDYPPDPGDYILMNWGALFSAFTARPPDVVVVADHGNFGTAHFLESVHRNLAPRATVLLDLHVRTPPFRVQSWCHLKVDEASAKAHGLGGRRADPGVWTVTTVGDRGLIAGGRVYPAPERLDDPVDVCGAGDQVTAVLAIGLARGWSFTKAASLAVVAGTEQCRRIGCTPLTTGELRGW